MEKQIILSFKLIAVLLLTISFLSADSYASRAQDFDKAKLPGRYKNTNISVVDFGSTDVFFYMPLEKYNLVKDLVNKINNEYLKLTVDINDYDCLTTEISAVASKYPDPIGYDAESKPIYADEKGHNVLESYAQNLSHIIKEKLGLNIQGLSREINFVLNQDAHKFHQDQSAKQFIFLQNLKEKSSDVFFKYKILQDLTLVDWDMSKDTLSATIIQDNLSDDRFLITLFPKESVGIIFSQSPKYLSRTAHPGYKVPTIFPYHAVLSPIDYSGSYSSGSAKGKRLSTVVRGVVLNQEIEKLKERSVVLSVNRYTSINNDTIREYKNGIVSFKTKKTLYINDNQPIYKHNDSENVEIWQLDSENNRNLISELVKTTKLNNVLIKDVKILRLIKKDGGFSKVSMLNLNIDDSDQIILLNASKIPNKYSYFNLSQDFTSEGMPWIQIYHFPINRIFKVSGKIFKKLSLTPIEEILFRIAEQDSMDTDGLSSHKKIVTKIDCVIFKNTAE